MRAIINTLFSILFVCTSCKPELRPIAYGKDNCEQCRMTVMNPQFAAALLSAKGKTFTFDAEECLVRYLKNNQKGDEDQFFVSDYMNPGSLIDASTAVFLHGDSIESPMGGNLAAFRNRNEAEAIRKVLGGKVLGWDEVVGR